MMMVMMKCLWQAHGAASDSHQRLPSGGLGGLQRQVPGHEHQATLPGQLNQSFIQ